MLGLGRLCQRLYQTNLPTNRSLGSSLIKIAQPIVSTSPRTTTVQGLSNRSISSSIIDSPGRRIIEYFEKYPELTDRCQFMIRQLESTLSDTQLHEFHRNLDHAIIADPKEHLIKLLTTCAMLKFGTSTTRWENYPIDDIEAIPGIGHRYSTSSFMEILEYLPDIIIDQHGKKPISFTELGGFAFNDSFLLALILQPFCRHFKLKVF